MSERPDAGAAVEKAPETLHAPAARLPDADLHPVADSLHNDQVVQVLLDGYPEVAVLLTEHRQIVACNQALLKLLGTTDHKGVVGRRVGEVLGCVHATELPGGCGTSETCQTCGAVNAMLGCQTSKEAARGECRISTGSADNPDAWDLEVVATQLKIGDEELMIFAARDIAAIKRHQALERLFFHDTLNVAGGIHGLAELLGSGEAFDSEVHPDRLRAMSRQLIEQIGSQRDLAAAERGELTASWSTVVVGDLFHDLRASYEAHPVARDRSIEFAATEVVSLQSDRVLLNRVLGNLVKNALEASEPGGQVTVRCEPVDDGQVRFTVHNETVMSRRVRLQVFKRSFSTKGGVGRGLGTFSVKLLTSQHLGGKVEFHSAEGSGTTFLVTVPRQQTANWKPSTTSSVQPQSDVHLRGRRVLLAEDGEDNQRLIGHILRKVGAEVTVVENGKLATEAALAAQDSSAPFDVILMDMQMPVMDGYEATSLLRQKGYTAPIIALTAHAMASDRQKCIDAGCDGYAAKPIDRQTLVETIQTHLHDDRTENEDGRTTDAQEASSALVSELADEDMLELVEMFVGELPDKIAAIKKAIDEQDMATLATLVHQLKGSAGGYGFPSITEVAAELEQRAKATEGIDAVTDALRQLVHLCRRATVGTTSDRPDITPESSVVAEGDSF